MYQWPVEQTEFRYCNMRNVFIRWPSFIIWVIAIRDERKITYCRLNKCQWTNIKDNALNDLCQWLFDNAWKLLSDFVEVTFSTRFPGAKRLTRRHWTLLCKFTVLICNLKPYDFEEKTVSNEVSRQQLWQSVTEKVFFYALWSSRTQFRWKLKQR
jgi:hypothetical protein